MLNCFYWYTVIWIMVLILYEFNLTDFNIKLDTGLIIFIIFTTVISLILGFVFRKELTYHSDDIEKKKFSKKGIILLTIAYILDFIYSKEIPFIAIAIKKTAKYGQYTGVPVLHVITIALSTYYAQKYFYNFLNEDCDKKKNVKAYIYIMFLFFLSYYRSMIIINLFMSFITYAALNKKKINIKKILLSIIVIMIVLYFYGGIGNIRDGYNWNDNSYIERIRIV